MLKELGKYFDQYTVVARFMPALFSVFPFVLTMLVWCPSSKTIIGSSLTILISFGVMTFISMVISNLGNKFQKRLFSIWGGAPTTVILRHADQTLDKYTKQRYHTWLNNKIDELNLPRLNDEVKDLADADLKYQSAINFLREFTRDKTKYPAVYRDNIAYGFARNLLAIRKFGLLISFICVIINLYLMWPVSGLLSKIDIDSEVLKDYFPGIGAGFASIVFVFVFLVVVNNNFVKKRGFRYARTLLGSCEKL